MTEEKKNENIYKKIMTARMEFMKSNPQKTGYNKFQNFKYFELMDIVPVATKICCKIGLYTHININEGKAVMTVVNMENVHEQLDFKIDAPMVRENDFNKMLQDVGRSETYLRRYLYILFLDITENDTVDGADQNSFKTPKPTKQKGKKTFKTANNYKNKETPIRKQAKGIIKPLEIQDKEINLLNAKIQLNEYLQNREIQEADCEAILKELEILLNGEEVQL